MNTPRIGVAISTRNRRPMFDRCFRYWRRYMPEGSMVVVVDDASDKPLRAPPGGETVENGSLYRLVTHGDRMGVAMTKNRGMAELLDAGCEHLFLADDDVYPVDRDWWLPYVESPEPHLSYQWANAMIAGPLQSGDSPVPHFEVEFPRGGMLYAERSAIEKVGGMDPAYGAWGGEHVEWQARIHAAGLTTWRYADFYGSDRLWGELRSRSTWPGSQRRRVFECTGIQWQKPRSRFVPYTLDHGEQDWDLGPEIVDTGQYSALRQVLDMAPAGAALMFGENIESARLVAERMPVIGNPAPDHNVSALGYIGLVRVPWIKASAVAALRRAESYLQPGCYVVAYGREAWREFVPGTGLGWTVVGHTKEQWVIRITGRSSNV